MNQPSPPLVTIAVPSFNQGSFLDDALTSIFAQDVPVEVFVADGGSTDGTLEVIKRWEPRLAGWRSHRDSGQSAAINECIARGSAPFVAWLNSDDVYLPNGLRALLDALQAEPALAVAYGKVWNTDEKLNRLAFIRTAPFSRKAMAARCIVSQPGTLIRRAAWEAVSGADASLVMSMDYDLWWRLIKVAGDFRYVDAEVAANRDHEQTKTNTKRRQHYRESMAIVRKYYGRVPLRWYLAWPISVWWRSLRVKQAR